MLYIYIYYSQNVKRLGGTVTEHPDRCTHLLVNCIARTMKFFMALTVAKYVITPEWITQSGKAGKFLGKNSQIYLCANVASKIPPPISISQSGIYS